MSNEMKDRHALVQYLVQMDNPHVQSHRLLGELDGVSVTMVYLKAGTKVAVKAKAVGRNMVINYGTNFDAEVLAGLIRHAVSRAKRASMTPAPDGALVSEALVFFRRQAHKNISAEVAIKRAREVGVPHVESWTPERVQLAFSLVGA